VCKSVHENSDNSIKDYLVAIVNDGEILTLFTASVTAAGPGLHFGGSGAIVKKVWQNTLPSLNVCFKAAAETRLLARRLSTKTFHDLSTAPVLWSITLRQYYQWEICYEKVGFTRLPRSFLLLFKNLQTLLLCDIGPLSKVRTVRIFEGRNGRMWGDCSPTELQLISNDICSFSEESGEERPWC